MVVRVDLQNLLRGLSVRPVAFRVAESATTRAEGDE